MPLPHEGPGIVCARAMSGRPLRSTCIGRDVARWGRRHDDISRLTVSRRSLHNTQSVAHAPSQSPWETHEPLQRRSLLTGY